MSRSETYETEMHLEATELRLGLPGSRNGAEKDNNSFTDLIRGNKRASVEESGSSTSTVTHHQNEDCPPPSKAQIVGWPPIRSYRKNSFQSKDNTNQQGDASGGYVKVSMDGAAYLRKIDLKMYQSNEELLKGLESLFMVCIGKYSETNGYNESEYEPTYQDKDGDWMLVGDVPWEMFISSCKRLRIMKSSEAKGLGCQ